MNAGDRLNAQYAALAHEDEKAVDEDRKEEGKLNTDQEKRV